MEQQLPDPVYDVLADPLRRRAYLMIRAGHRAVSREEAAAALGISHNLAAFHLDKLLEAGLLTAHYARPPGRGGRGAGRPAKWYAATDLEVGVQIPPRSYDLAGKLLVQAVAEADNDEVVRRRTRQLARETGQGWGERGRGTRRLRQPGAARSLAAAVEVLADAGYEPVVEDDAIVLWNCPFHALADTAREVVCGFNHELVAGVLDGLQAEDLTAVLEPAEGRCCVVVRPVRPDD